MNNPTRYTHGKLSEGSTEITGKIANRAEPLIMQGHRMHPHSFDHHLYKNHHHHMNFSQQRFIHPT